MTLKSDAIAAWEAEKTADAAARQQAIDAFKLEARTELLKVISPVTWAASGLQVVHTDLNDRFAVVSDGTVSLSVHKNQQGEFIVHLVTGQGEEWTRRSEEPLKNLADLGEAISKAGI